MPCPENDRLNPLKSCQVSCSEKGGFLLQAAGDRERPALMDIMEPASKHWSLRHPPAQSDRVSICLPPQAKRRSKDTRREIAAGQVLSPLPIRQSALGFLPGRRLTKR